MPDKTLIPRASSREAQPRLIEPWRRLVGGVSQTHRRVIASVEAHGVQGPWFEVLVTLLESPGHRLSMSRLAHEVAMTSGGLTKLVDRLERAGLTDRHNDPSDRRLVNAGLTPKGLTVARAAVDEYDRSLSEVVLGTLSQEQISEIAQLLGRLRETPGRG